MQADIFTVIGVVLTGIFGPTALTALLERRIEILPWALAGIGIALIALGHMQGPSVPFGLRSVADAFLRVIGAATG